MTSSREYRSQLKHHLPNDIIPRVPVKAQNNEMKSQGRQLVEVYSVKGEIFVIHRIQSPPHYPSLYLVLLFRKQLKFHVWIAALSCRVFCWEIFTSVHGYNQCIFVKAVFHGAMQGSQNLVWIDQRCGSRRGCPSPHSRVIRAYQWSILICDIRKISVHF